MSDRFEDSGDIRSTDLLSLLVALWRAKANGALRFSRAGATAGFDLSDGEIVGASSSEARFETAAILVRAGKLESSALERLSLPPGADVALAAVGAGILTRREWKWGEKIRAIEILSDLLTWPEGRYTFDSSARPAAGEFTLSVPRLVLELFLRSRDRKLIEQRLGAGDVPLARTGDFDEEFATFGLTADAESVVRLIDGRATAAEIAEKAPAEEFAVLKLLAALATLELIRPAAALAGEEQETDAATEEEPVPAEEPSEELSPEPPVVASVPDSASDQFPQRPEEESDARFDAAAAARQLDAWNALPARENSPTAGRFESRPEMELSAEPPPDPVPESPLSDARLSRDTGAEESPRRAEPSPDWSPLPAPSRDVEGSHAEPPPREPAARTGPWLATGALLLIAAAIAAVLIVRSRSSRMGMAAPAIEPSPASPARAASSTAPPGAAAAPPSGAQRRSAVPTAGSRGKSAESGRAAETERGASEWARRAQRDRARLAADRRTRYAVQVALLCETRSLGEAWKHDRPAGSLWLLPVSHQGRDCYRVLWGRYPTLAAARAAKPRVPAFFSTPQSRPTVVSVR